MLASTIARSADDATQKLRVCADPDAVTGEKRQNLRNLAKKYGERMDEIFATTPANGRLSKGMPKRVGEISDDEIATIKSYLDTVQEK